MLAGWFDPDGGSGAELARAFPETPTTVALGDHGEVVCDGGPGGVARSGDWLCVLDGILWARPDGPSDAEVMAREWGRSGETGLHAIKGEWLAVLFHEPSRRLVLACDPAGGRTVFFSVSGTPWRFASELAPLLSSYRQRPAPDQEALVGLMQIQPPRGGRTALRDVHRLGLGSLVEFDRRRREWRRWYVLRPEPPLQVSRTEAAGLLRTGIAEAIERRAPATVPTAISLSGGLDSATVAAVAHDRRAGQEGAASLRVYSAVFPGDPRMDESQHVVALRTALDLQGTALCIRPSGLLKRAADHIRRWRTPIAGPGLLLDDAMMERAAGDGMQIALDGQGGDEVFGASGYLIADRLKRLRLISALALCTRQPRYGAEPGWRTIALLLDHYGLRAALPPSVHKRLRRWRSQPAPARSWLAPAWASTSPADPWAWKEGHSGVPRWWAFQVATLTEEREATGLAEYSRRRAAAHGLIGRPPLLDADLVRLVLRLPPEAAFDRVLDRALLREALRGLVPDAVRLRERKTRLGAFYNSALIADLPAVRRLLGSKDTLVRQYTVDTELHKLLDDPRPVGTQGWTTWLEATWGLLSVELWLRDQADAGFLEALTGSGELTDPSSEVWSP